VGIGIGTHIGSYQIVGALGAGGMGEVYRGRDTRLDRDVAIKLLPEAFAHDPERLARFEREAKTLAALNHPNIASIYGIEEGSAVTAGVASGFSRTIRALILELVEGPTLADLIERRSSPSGPAGQPGPKGPGLPLDEVLPIARQIVDALEAAHEKGIIHRDLKPANIKLRPDGTVKVLDFGLAKLAQSVGPDGAELTASPTITTPAMTGVGVILGTAAYMAPEQARGKAVDRRADVWAFGCVLYEMLTGRRAFGGEDVTDTIAAVVRAEPDWSALPPDTPASIRRLLRRCLQKDVRERLPEIGTARLEIRDAQTQAAEGAVQEVTGSSRRSDLSRRAWLAWVSAVVLLAVVAVALGLLYWRQSAAPAGPEMRVEISTPQPTDPHSFALSPDMRHLVFSAMGEDGQSRLWLRPLYAVSARELAGTEGATYPFWSPDSRSVGFFAADKVKRIDIVGGPPQIMADAPAQGRGGTWNSDGTILFAFFDLKGNGLLRVSASGGPAVMATPLRAGRTQRFPQFLPDGDHFLFFERTLTPAGAPGAERALYLGSLTSGETWRLTAADTAGLYARGGWILFIREGVLLAQRLDLSRRELAGDPITIAENVHYDGNALNGSAVTVSTSGAVAYRTGRSGRRQLTWFDRTGKNTGTIGAVDDDLSSIELSPDGRRAAVYRRVLGGNDVWVLDNERTTRFTFDPSADLFPIWSSDGQRIVFDSNRSGTRHLYIKDSSGGGQEQLLLDTPNGNKMAHDFSPDGRFLLFAHNDPKTSFDMWVLPLAGDRKPFAFLSTNFEERTGQFSPDGRWIAYVSNESGRAEVYVRPFPPSAGQWQISTAGGAQPRWAPTGKEMYYVAPDATLMAVPIVVTGNASEPGAPVALFQTRIWDASVNNRIQYDVAKDGRFLINVSVDQDALSPITLLLNWNPERQN
jgi:Tol biopolymer transport system component